MVTFPAPAGWSPFPGMAGILRSRKRIPKGAGSSGFPSPDSFGEATSGGCYFPNKTKKSPLSSAAQRTDEWTQQASGGKFPRVPCGSLYPIQMHPACMSGREFGEGVIHLPTPHTQILRWENKTPKVVG